jgi:hypothetical protein
MSNITIACYRWVQLRVEARGESLAEAIANERVGRDVLETTNDIMGDPEYYLLTPGGEELPLHESEVILALEHLDTLLPEANQPDTNN